MPASGPGDPPPLAPRYAAVSINGNPLPVVLRTAGNVTETLVADTLTFSSGAGTYTETATVAVDSAGLRRTDRRLVPSTPYTRQGQTTLLLPTFVGGSGTFTYSFISGGILDAAQRVWGFVTF